MNYTIKFKITFHSLKLIERLELIASTLIDQNMT